MAVFAFDWALVIYFSHFPSSPDWPTACPIDRVCTNAGYEFSMSLCCAPTNRHQTGQICVDLTMWVERIMSFARIITLPHLSVSCNHAGARRSLLCNLRLNSPKGSWPFHGLNDTLRHKLRLKMHAWSTSLQTSRKIRELQDWRQSAAWSALPEHNGNTLRFDQTTMFTSVDDTLQGPGLHLHQVVRRHSHHTTTEPFENQMMYSMCPAICFFCSSVCLHEWNARVFIAKECLCVASVSFFSGSSVTNSIPSDSCLLHMNSVVTEWARWTWKKFFTTGFFTKRRTWLKTTKMLCFAIKEILWSLQRLAFEVGSFQSVQRDCNNDSFILSWR